VRPVRVVDHQTKPAGALTASSQLHQTYGLPELW
jgi:hypothetical protein